MKGWLIGIIIVCIFIVVVALVAVAVILTTGTSSSTSASSGLITSLAHSSVANSEVVECGQGVSYWLWLQPFDSGVLGVPVFTTSNTAPPGYYTAINIAYSQPYIQMCTLLPIDPISKSLNIFQTTIPDIGTLTVYDSSNDATIVVNDVVYTKQQEALGTVFVDTSFIQDLVPLYIYMTTYAISPTTYTHNVLSFVNNPGGITFNYFNDQFKLYAFTGLNPTIVGYVPPNIATAT